MPSTDPASVGEWAQLLRDYGALPIFAIVSAALNLMFISSLIMGKLVPYKMYKKAMDEADRLQQTMEKERGAVMNKLLTFMSGLKTSSKEGKDNGNPNSRDDS